MVGLTAAAVAVGAVGVASAHRLVGPALLGTAFALFAAAAAFALEEPANAVVDVTPTGRGRQTAVRGIALALPLAAGLALILATMLRGTVLSAAALSLALVGNVLFGFAVAASGRRGSGEPGAWASVAVALVLTVPPVFAPVARHIQTFPAGPPGSGRLPSDTLWWLVSLASIVAIKSSTAGQTARSCQVRRPVVGPSAFDDSSDTR
jgi:hypothetical protein